MAEDGGDTLMVMKVAGTRIGGESSSTLTKGDKLTEDFLDGFYFDVLSFAFTMALLDDEGGGAATPGPRTKPCFPRWRATAPGSKPAPPFRPMPARITIVRALDNSSPNFLKVCLDKKIVTEAAMVRRGRIGEAGLFGLLRLDFEKLAMKGVEWTDGPAVLETVTLEFQKVKINYIRRKDDGGVASSWGGTWKR